MTEIEGDTEFREFLRNKRAPSEEPRIPARRFRRVTLTRGHGESQVLALESCAIEDSDLSGLTSWMHFLDVTMKKVDFSHTGGRAHWSRCVFDRVSFRSLMARVSAVECEFRNCDFRGAVLKSPFFLRCTFGKGTLKGLVSQEALLIDCLFSDTDLGESHWESPGILRISGRWNGELSSGSSDAAKEAFATQR